MNSPFAIKLSCAIHLAKAVLRHDELGQVEDADRVQNRFAALVLDDDRADDLLVAVARKLGRKRALAVSIEPEVVEIAARMPAERFAAMVGD